MSATKRKTNVLIIETKLEIINQVEMAIMCNKSVFFNRCAAAHWCATRPCQVFRRKLSSFIYSRTCQIRHLLIRQFAQVVTFFVSPGRIPIFCVRFSSSNSHGLVNCQFSHFVTSFFPEKHFVELLRHLQFRF